jgi:hypothetical protein
MSFKTFESFKMSAREMQGFISNLSFSNSAKSLFLRFR